MLRLRFGLGGGGGSAPRPSRVPVPARKRRGVGDLLKGLSKALGIKPCGGCEGRAQALNRLTGGGEH